jgi:methyl-accepting chemotaxis protein
MMKNLSNGLKDAGKLGLLFTLLFIVGALASAYFMFTLPHHLVMKGGLAEAQTAWSLFVAPFAIIGLTFVSAGAALAFILAQRKEVVVYVEKRRDETSGGRSGDIDGKNALDVKAFTTSLNGSTKQDEVFQKGLNLICQQVQAGQGALYLLKSKEGKRSLAMNYGFAITADESSIEWGEGLVGQAAAAGKTLHIDEIPEGYISILSGLGEASPRFLTFVPLKKGKEVVGVLELATFQTIDQDGLIRLGEMVDIISEKTK